MLPETEERQKTKTVFESWDKHQLAIKQGYYNQFSRNTLQRNLGNGNFIELGRQANVSATEWSWSALLFDMDNDGYKDIYVSNGIYKDLLDRDYLTYEANDEAIRNRINSNEKEVIKNLIDVMPSKAVPNATFHNLGNFNFENKSKDWGLDQPSFSNGSAYADLDNDGDLDIVVNNVNMRPFIYENKTDTLTSRSVMLKFLQKDKNVFGIATKATIKYANNKRSYSENYNSRGFQSSVANGIHFGVGNAKSIDSLFITWSDGTTSIMSNLATNKTYEIEQPIQPDTMLPGIVNTSVKPILEEVKPLFNFAHSENSYVDFNKERLLTQMYSNEGPCLAVGDINNDNNIDYFVGGAKNQSGALFVSSPTGFNKITKPFIDDINSEDTDATFFDGDNDGDLDLYVCHGGRAYSQYSIALNDAYYINNNGTFEKSLKALSFPKTISSSVVKPVDYDNDGDQDLFVGERYKTNLYGKPCSGYLLENDGNGNFKHMKNDAMENIGMIKNASWVDINNDGLQDLIVSGEWMPIRIFINENKRFVDKTNVYEMENTSGLWSAMEMIDVDNDGDLDIVAGNMGLNNFFESDMRMYIHDFDNNGFEEQLICKKKDGNYYPIVDKDALISQIPSLKKKLLYYKDYANASIETIFSKELLSQAYIVDLKMLKSTIFLNENNKFVAQNLPSEVQYSPIYAITADDINEDGYTDLFFGGNQYLVKPRFGRYDASMGWALFGSKETKVTTSKPVPLNIKGQIRGLKWIKHNNNKLLIATINNEKTSFYTIKE